jgi:hypothetical protein
VRTVGPAGCAIATMLSTTACPSRAAPSRHAPIDATSDCRRLRSKAFAPVGIGENVLVSVTSVAVKMRSGLVAIEQSYDV